jgi:heme-degrading monooxygenase HmoA
MILEIAQIDIKPGMEKEFEANVAKAVPIFQKSKGCKGIDLRRGVETPGSYRLFVTWETLENHTVDFKESGNWAEWRKLVGHCFASPPSVAHWTKVNEP